MMADRFPPNKDRGETISQSLMVVPKQETPDRQGDRGGEGPAREGVMFSVFSLSVSESLIWLY